jgi:hypothetical protein
MSAESITLALLEAAAGVTALVGSRIYFDARPEADPLPALVYQVISDGDSPPIDATPGSTPALARVQINCLAATAEQRTALAEQVYQAGAKKSGEIAATHVQAVFPERGPSSYDAMVETYQQPVDYLIHFIR